MNNTIKKGQIVEKIGNKIRIFDPEKSELYSLNESASYIFGKIRSGAKKNEIIRLLKKKYGLTTIQAKHDYSNLVKEMRKRKIIAK